MDYELLATSAIKSSVSKTDRLKAFINEGDKEPSWDGHIYIYDNKKYDKENIKKIAVQVKGKGVKHNTIPKSITYSAEVKDLENFMNNYGGIYFVVYIDNNSGDALQIYYASLTPFRIKSILAKGKRKSPKRSMVLEKFPDNNNDKIGIMLRLYTEIQKQVSFIGKDSPTIDELTAQGVLKNLTITADIPSPKSIFDIPKMINGRDLTIYAHTTGSDAPIPIEYIEKVQSLTMMSENIYQPITVNEIEYYDHYRYCINAETISVHIGTSVVITFPNGQMNKKQKMNISINVKGTLNERIQSLRYIIAIIENRVFDIDISYQKLDHNLEKYRQELNGLEAAKEMFQRLNVTADLDMDNCTESDFRHLNILIGSILDNKPLHGVTAEYPLVCKFPISNITLAIICRKNKDNSYSFYDFFNEKIILRCSDDKNGESHFVSQFSILKTEYLLSIDNINFDYIIEDFKSVGLNRFNSEYCNQLVLELLHSYDIEPRKCFLETAKELTDYLIETDTQDDNNINSINAMQIIARERLLSYSEKQQLNKIISETDSENIKLGCFLLLDEQDEAQKIIDNMTNEEWESFSKFPICLFYRRSDTNPKIIPIKSRILD